jgi:hypothetical protein
MLKNSFSSKIHSGLASHDDAITDYRMLKMAVQQGHRRIETGGVPSGYVEDFDELRTKLADFFSILLGRRSLK